MEGADELVFACLWSRERNCFRRTGLHDRRGGHVDGVTESQVVRHRRRSVLEGQLNLSSRRYCDFGGIEEQSVPGIRADSDFDDIRWGAGGRRRLTWGLAGPADAAGRANSV